MCGVLGALGPNSDSEFRDKFNSALNLLSARGPDAVGIYFDDVISLGHHRLSILDLDTRSNQPFVSSCGRWVLVFNGEIYNHNELRELLKKEGVVFRTTSDTEVVLYGMSKIGPDFLKKMNGIWAFALWDKLENQLLLSRDHVGIKPLYYYQDEEQFLFSSEIKPILKLCSKITVDRNQIHSLVYRYQPNWSTPFRGVKLVEPGTFCTLSLDRKMTEKKYWSIKENIQPVKISDAEAIETFSNLFESSVKRQILADVPVGAFLSGGIDSSSIVAVGAKLTPSMKVFSIDMGPGENETSQSEELARSLSLPFYKCSILQSQIADYKNALYRIEEPILDSILLATQSLSSFTSQSVKVVLSGEGADEILGGYAHQRVLSKEYKFLDILSPGLSQAAISVVSHLPIEILEKFFPYNAKLGRSGLARLKKHLSQYPNRVSSYLSLVKLFDEEVLADLIPSLCLEKIDWEKLFNPYKSDSILQATTKVDSAIWNSRYSLMRLDKLTMAFGLEARVPFLDRSLIEFSLGLPDSQRFRLGQEKWILRKAASQNGWLPDKISKRKKKAFYLPIEKIFKETFITHAKEILLDSSVKRRKFFSSVQLEKLLSKEVNEIVTAKQITALIMLEYWLCLFEDGDWQGYSLS